MAHSFSQLETRAPNEIYQTMLTQSPLVTKMAAAEERLVIHRGAAYRVVDGRPSVLRQMPQFPNLYAGLTVESGGRPARCAIKFENGGLFVGSCENQQFAGQGSMVLSTGALYTGEFQAGLPHGKGSLVHGDTTVQGFWKEGKPHGHVHLRSAAQTFEGEYADGKRTGQGQASYADGSRYEGAWLEGKRHGRGVLVLRDGRRVEGRWEADALVPDTASDGEPPEAAQDAGEAAEPLGAESPAPETDGGVTVEQAPDDTVPQVEPPSQQSDTSMGGEYSPQRRPTDEPAEFKD
jgi:hypothetical protein